MIVVLDTNVISAVVKDDLKVIEWLNHDPTVTFATTVVTVFELRYGLERMPVGKRRADFADKIADALAPFAGRILIMHREAAELAGHFRAAREAIGRPVAPADCFIAAIAAHAGARLATRNTRDFDGLPLLLLDPWSD
ncbi:MAG: PIN domain-containing protein [Hyphomicrobiaceae bacterium]|nr:PIN domain-containing protein [Hyphomicrobiaceae bacterium]